MKAALALVLLPLAFHAASASTDASVCQEHAVAAVVGVNSSGTVRLCIRAPAEVADPDDAWQLSATLTSPALSGSNPNLSLSLVNLNGCIASAPTAVGSPNNNAQGPTGTTTWTITMTSTLCRFDVRSIVTSGSAEVSDLAIAHTVRTDHDWIEKLSRFAGIVWLVAITLTRLIRGGLYADGIRIAADFIVSAAILSLPMPDDQWRLIAVSTYLVIVADSFLALERNGAT